MDFFALFDERHRCEWVELLVRVPHYQRTEDPDRKFFATLAA